MKLNYRRILDNINTLIQTKDLNEWERGFVRSMNLKMKYTETYNPTPAEKGKIKEIQRKYLISK